MELTDAAKTALLNASPRQGAQVHGDRVVITELFDQGMVGPEDGLTMRGTIARERLVNAALDAAF